MAAGIETCTYEQLNHAAKRAKQKNRAVLEQTLGAIVFLGRCSLPLRGRRDSGHPLTSTLDQSIGFKEGNFRALFPLTATCGDEVMNKHIQTCSRNATYISWSAQNELIQAIGAVLTKKIVAKINEAKFFTLMADKTID